MRRPDPALAAVIACVVLLGTASALSTPVGVDLDYTSDEPWHLSYVQSLAERGELPEEVGDGGWIQRKVDAVSTEQQVAETLSGVGYTEHHRVRVHPLWTPRTERRWRAANGGLSPDDRADGGGRNELAYMPPGYYAALVLPYELTGGTWFDRALVLRLVSTALIASAAALGWWLALALGLGRPAALVVAGVVGLNPHAIQLAGVVNPDAAILPLWTGALLAGTLLLTRGFSLGRAACLLAAAAALPLVKPVGIAVLPAAALALGLSLWRRLGRRAAVAMAGAAGAAFVALAVVATERVERPLVRGDESLTEMPAYLAQFYLPIDSFRDNLYVWNIVRVLAVGDHVPASLAPAVLALLTLAAAVWLAARPPAVPLAAAAFVGLASLTLLAGLHWNDYSSLLRGGGTFSQPRYFLPLVPGAALLLGAAAARLPPRHRGWAIAGLLALCAGASAAWVLERGEIAYA